MWTLRILKEPIKRHQTIGSFLFRLFNVSGSLPPDELEKSLGDTNRQFTIWNDGGEWLISLKGKEQEQCKILREWLGGNDR